MCLVSYWKTDSGDVILTSNRDEDPRRSVNQIQCENNNGVKLVYPQDTKGGSWFFTSSKGSAAIILNGAFKPHERQDQYRLSRGIMLKNYFSYQNLSDFLDQYSFHDIEPFTMIVFEDNGLFEFRWDGAVKYIEILNSSKLHVWSSCTLYTQEIQLLREDKFIQLFRDHSVKHNQHSIKKIHAKGSLDDERNDFLMNRDGRVKTISISQVLIKKTELDFSFENLLLGDLHQQIVTI